MSKCRATTPCIWHDQVIVALTVDGKEIPEVRINKGSFQEMTQAYPDPPELFHLLADMAVQAHTPIEETPQTRTRQGDFAQALAQGGIW